MASAVVEGPALVEDAVPAFVPAAVSATDPAAESTPVAMIGVLGSGVTGGAIVVVVDVVDGVVFSRTYAW